MVCRQGPQLPSLMQDKAFEADEVMRPKAADSHQGQGREKSRNRPDRFVHSTLSAPTDRLAREASIDCPARHLFVSLPEHRRRLSLP
jgi:hypothetical protein